MFPKVNFREGVEICLRAYNEEIHIRVRIYEKVDQVVLIYQWWYRSHISVDGVRFPLNSKYQICPG